MEPLQLMYDRRKQIKNEKSAYRPEGQEAAVLAMIRRHFTLGYTNMYTPRVEFSDLSTIQRAMVDQMSFNTYQPNNGESYPGDAINSWRSHAMRPIVRNKVISIAAHATARLLFPKVFAWNENNDDQRDAAQVMSDLMEWSGEESDYTMTTLYNTLSALVNPVAIVYTEYCEIYRTVKREKLADGTYRTEEIIDEVLSGFKDTIVSPDELFIENFFEPDVQKQAWLVWRRVISYDMAQERFGKAKNFECVKPGIQVVFNDANQSFYQVYDPNMRPYMVEWVQYYNRAEDLKIDVLNGIMVSDADNCNPRNDKLYPFTWTGYEIINNRCAYFKALAFKLMHDANIINTLYPMIIDGTYLDLFKPMVIAGEENVPSNIIVPGRASTLTNPQATITPIQLGTNMKSGFDALGAVEESVNQSSESPAVPENPKNVTAEAIATREQEKNVILGLFIQMIGSFVKQYGRLRMGDILQYMTIGQVDSIEDSPELVYKTFLLHNKGENGNKTRKIQLSKDMPMTLPAGLYDKKVEDMSFNVLKEQGGMESDQELYKVNPELYRNYKFKLVISPDVMNPLSASTERAYNLEIYDRAIQNPIANQEAVFELLLQSTPTTKKDPKKFITQNQGQLNPQNPLAAAQGTMSMQNAPQPTAVPLAPQTNLSLA